MTDGIHFFPFSFRRICNLPALSWGFAIPFIIPSPLYLKTPSHPP